MWVCSSCDVPGPGLTLGVDAQTYTGFDEWDMASESMTTVPRGITIAFWVIFAIEVAAYVVGWPLMEILGRKRRARELGSVPFAKEARSV